MYKPDYQFKTEINLSNLPRDRFFPPVECSHPTNFDEISLFVICITLIIIELKLTSTNYRTTFYVNQQ
jgi:hypothetical protein